MSEITLRIDSVLSEKGISKKEFYEKCGITSAAYSQWNTGKTEPKASSLKRISAFLNTNYEWIKFGTGQKEAPAQEGERQISDSDIKFALFGDTAEIDDADLEDVKRYAAFVKERKLAKKNGAT